jgi:hypothetical protein
LSVAKSVLTKRSTSFISDVELEDIGS